MNILLRWLLGAVAALITFYVARGIRTSTFYASFMLALIIGLVNAFIPYFIGAFSFTRTLATLGVFMLGINAFLLFLIQSLHLGVYFESPSVLILAAMMISVFTWFATLALESKLFK